MGKMQQITLANPIRCIPHLGTSLGLRSFAAEFDEAPEWGSQRLAALTLAMCMELMAAGWAVQLNCQSVLGC